MPGLLRPPIRRALSVAIKYSHLGEPHVLPGTHHDPQMLKNILTEFMHFKEEDIVTLVDDEHHGEHLKPTYKNIRDAMRNLLEGAQAGDHFVFHFSGHGDQVPNLDGTEDDGLDEIIWPVDVELAPDGTVAGNFIKDDEIHDILVDHTPPGAHFMMIFDCCHSGTAADLPNSSSKEPPPKSVRVRATDHNDSVVPLQSVAPEKHHRTPVRHKIDGPDVTSWSACADDETTPEGNSGGMFLKAFYRALRRHKDATRGELLNDIAEIVKTKVDKHNQSLSRIHGRNCSASDCRGGCSTDDLSIGLPTPELASTTSLVDTYEAHVLDEDYPD